MVASSSSGSGRLNPEVVYWHFVNGRADELFRYLDSIPGAFRGPDCRSIMKAAVELRRMGSVEVGEPLRITKNRAARRYELAQSASKYARQSRLFQPEASGNPGSSSTPDQCLNSSSNSKGSTSSDMNQLDSSLSSGNMITS